MQRDNVIEYTSRASTSTEQGDAQIEKEFLAIVFPMERWHTYSYGRHVVVHGNRP
jgi:hypothetical protein